MAATVAAPPTNRADPVSQLRAFNRFYTRVIGVLEEGLLRTPYSLTEARVIFELAQRPETDLGELRRTLDIDAGYLSRIISRFESDGLLVNDRSTTDGRRHVIRLTRAGGRVFETLNRRSADENEQLLAKLSQEQRQRLLEAMTVIRNLLEDAPNRHTVTLRSLESGDYGWVVERHGAVYRQEYGWDETFEALVARIVADYIDHRDPLRENAWIAEVGCIFCVKKSEKIAQLRILLVEPHARGAGVGTRLVDECLRFARGAGYIEMMLWTNDILVDARRIYERFGFKLIEEERHHSFGKDLVGQNWAVTL
jgi:DNA-binding MarR family transcriptional regulator/GNAT superfamily N-acetyltransferase